MTHSTVAKYQGIAQLILADGFTPYPNEPNLRTKKHLLIGSVDKAFSGKQAANLSTVLIRQLKELNEVTAGNTPKHLAERFVVSRQYIGAEELEQLRTTNVENLECPENTYLAEGWYYYISIVKPILANPVAENLGMQIPNDEEPNNGEYDYG